MIPELARAMFLQGDYQRLLEQFGTTVLKQPLAEADLKMTLARAYGGLGRRDPARRAAEAALTAVPEYGPAKIFVARLQADTGDIDGALAALDMQLQHSPQDAEGWQVKGDLLMYGQTRPRRRAGGLPPGHRGAAEPCAVAHGAMTVLLSQAAISRGRASSLPELQKILPNHPQTAYFAANVAMLGKDLDKAKEISDQLLRVAGDNPRVLQLAGAIEFERRNWAQAESHLAKAIQLNPSLEVSRRLLAGTYLQRSRAGQGALGPPAAAGAAEPAGCGLHTQGAGPSAGGRTGRGREGLRPGHQDQS